MEDQRTKDGAVTGSKADQKKDSTEGPLSETEVCSDFCFIEPALKCTLPREKRLVWVQAEGMTGMTGLRLARKKKKKLISSSG